MIDKRYPLKCDGVCLSVVDMLCFGRRENISGTQSHKNKYFSCLWIMKSVKMGKQYLHQFCFFLIWICIPLDLEIWHSCCRGLCRGIVEVGESWASGTEFWCVIFNSQNNFLENTRIWIYDIYNLVITPNKRKWHHVTWRIQECGFMAFII